VHRVGEAVVVERRAIEIRGIVQGVGFRPFVYNLAVRHGLAGFVRNQNGDVVIEVEGDPSSIERFLNDVSAQSPPLSRIQHVTWHSQSPSGENGFRIETSAAEAAGPIFFSPDVAVCRECVAEMRDPADRRFGYPLINCANCGPRLTIICGAPYDRSRTTMAGFIMCPACRKEYDDPANRRYHAQPTACPACGPELRALDANGEPLSPADPLAWFADGLREGRIGALKGLGGFHLVCDATRSACVAELRRRKHRDEKPFAVMVADAASAALIAKVGDAEKALLESPRAPIVLVPKRPSAIAEEVAPRNPCLGVMLSYTPLHHLLMAAMVGTPLVMTSGNRSDEPIAYRDDDAVRQLAGIADFFLVHGRPIHVRCDDSVTRVVDGAELPLRRSRGYAPRPIALPDECPCPMLAVGGQLKGTFALGRDHQAIVSHHLGDLDHLEAYRAFDRDVRLYEELFAIAPEVLVHDLHPDYATTRYAIDRSGREHRRVIAVQHHHAHLASCIAEHGMREPAIGVIFDGTGYGLDGAIWGGEFLIGDASRFERAAHLRYVPLPGSDRAIREPWRVAAAHLSEAKVECPGLTNRVPPGEWRTIQQMIEHRFNSPLTSSAGRLFDAIAALLGVRDRVSYEGQAAVELEWLASMSSADGSYPFELDSQVIDTRPLIAEVVAESIRGTEPRHIARRFHRSVVEIIVAVCTRIRTATGLDQVVLSGGVFLNVLLTRETVERLSREGFRVYRHREVPPSDAGLSLGQLAVAIAQLRTTPK
jgi:hydrogenase maturation protein HypF